MKKANGQAERTRRRAADAYVNTLARLGLGQQNLLSAGEYPMARLTQNQSLMTSLYRGNWIARRIVDTVAEDMCKNWITLSGVPCEMASRFAREERRGHVREKVLSALKWARLYGGAAGLLLLEGQEDRLDQPLDLAEIQPGQFRGILVVDRWNGVTPSPRLVENLSDPDFGLPDSYEFSFPGGETAPVKVHHSRVLRFVSRELPYQEQVAECWWGASELEHVYDELNKRDATSANIAQLIFQANLRVLKMSDFGEILASSSAEAQRDLYGALRAQNTLMSSMGLQVLDREDSFETHSYAFGGVSDVYELFMLDVAGAAEIPATRLFGRAPAGLNATGEGDLRTYYDSVREKQQSALRPVLDKLAPVVGMSAWGSVPSDLDYDFAPVRDLSDRERAELAKMHTETVLSAFGAGLASREAALAELGRRGRETGFWVRDAWAQGAEESTHSPTNPTRR